MMNESLSGLYYPFSRTFDVESLKQMLLIFDSVTFLDPVDDDGWRRTLRSNIANSQGGYYSRYKDVDYALPILFQEGLIKKVDPFTISSEGAKVAAASSLCDLNDENWAKFAGDPARYGMPHLCDKMTGAATWQIFRSKLPLEFIQGLSDWPEGRRHIFYDGGENTAWTLSYAAGSAITTNLHLSAAEQMNLAPVTDSEMHHNLLLAKFAAKHFGAGFLERKRAGKMVSASLSAQLVQGILPRTALSTMDIEQILRFREETATLRREALQQIEAAVEAAESLDSPERLHSFYQGIQISLSEGIHSYRDEMASIREKLWPGILETMSTKAIVPGSAAALALSYTGGPLSLMLGTVVACSVAFLKTGLDLRAQELRVKRSTAPMVSYLTRVQDFH